MLEKIKAWGKDEWFRAIVLTLVVAIGIAATVAITFWMFSLRDPDTLQWFENIIKSLGIWGWFLLLGLQYIQIVLAFIPGGPIQIIAGALYGPIGGVAVCFLGTILATATIFYIVSRFGQRVVTLIVGNKHIKDYEFLQNDKKLKRLVLLLYFIPGTPKDALTYIFALTPIPMSQFLVISTLARLPAVLTSVLAGDSIINGEWLKVIFIFLILGAISFLGLLIHKKVMGPIHAQKKL